MESLGYVLIYFLRGSLPWQGLKVDSNKHKEELILRKKQSTSIDELRRGFPEEFQSYFKHVYSLGFDESPDHTRLRRLFSNLFHRQGYEHDNVFDWTVLKFLEHLKTDGQSPDGSNSARR